jgi:hypothetical protein
MAFSAIVGFFGKMLIVEETAKQPGDDQRLTDINEHGKYQPWADSRLASCTRSVVP